MQDAPRPPRRKLRLNFKSAYLASHGLAGGVYRRMGFKGKTVWDWLPLLLLLVVAASIFLSVSRFMTPQSVQRDRLVQQITDQQEHSTQEEILQQQSMMQQLATPEASVIAQIGGLVDQEHEQNLANYLDRISALLISRSSPLLQSRPGSLERTLAQVRTTDILNSFSSDAPRKAIVIQFLHDVGLIQVNTGAIKGPIVSLAIANLAGLTLPQANLGGANLDGAILTSATLTGAILSSSSMRGAVLTKAKFIGANLTGADLSGTNLEGADFTGAILKGANLGGADTKGATLKGAIF
ncbi:MAG: pentapeptide repeat-containing protein [Ktedonobacteraceae bacterium]|nr:pentapeptide repeat-containing protein [Ktedonobacteraceae bacterium]